MLGWIVALGCLRIQPGLSPREPGILGRRRTMSKIWAALLIVASFLMLAPVIESGTSESTQFFQAIGNADGGGF
jgi:hypothetical protein